MKNKKQKGIIITSFFIIVVLIFSTFWYFYGLGKVTANKEVVTFNIKAGQSKIQIVENLKKANLIKSEIAVYIYLFLHSDLNLQTGSYELYRNMTADDIIKYFATGKTKVDIVKITFIEGKRLKAYAEEIAKNFNLTTEEVLTKLEDAEFLTKLKEKYWFITDEILDENIYYPLEGYLYPETYEFYQNASLESIVYKMLDTLAKKLEKYKTVIENGTYTTHQIITMASIIEKEAVTTEDRKTVSQVIYTRLGKQMALGMDVTTYYAVQKSLTESLTNNDLSSESKYNTRNSNLIGLPVGPICNPSLDSIEAVFSPSETNYIYFYADIVTGKVYFAQSYEEFLKYKQELGG